MFDVVVGEVCVVWWRCEWWVKCVWCGGGVSGGEVYVVWWVRYVGCGMVEV